MFQVFWASFRNKKYFQFWLKAVGECSEKKRKVFQREYNSMEFTPWFFGVLTANLGEKNLSDVQVMVNTSTFLKISMTSFHLEMNYMRVFKNKKMILTIKIVRVMYKESTRWFCQKCPLEPISLKFHIWGFSGIKKISFDYWILFRQVIEGLIVDRCLFTNI